MLQVGDLITVRYRGEWKKAFIIVVESDDRHFTVRFFDDTIPDKELVYSRFQDHNQRGWWLDNQPNTCQG